MGAWYLLALFSYRIVLPEVRRIRGGLFLGIILTVFTCLGKDIGSELALRKSLGFFVYFIIGYKMTNLPKIRIGKVATSFILIIVLIVLIIISRETDWYSSALFVFCKDTDASSFTHWYYAPIVYLLSFVFTSLVMMLVMNVIPEKCRWLEKHGKDTMPMYISHLLLFMAGGYLINKNNWIITVGVSFGFIIVSLLLFSANWYRKIFNGVLEGIKKLIFREC